MRLFLDINSTRKSGAKHNEFVEVELGKGNQLSLTHTFDSLTNPIDYVAEYSYEVLIPKTKRNNQIFDNIYRIDHYITSQSFDPNTKLKYYIQSNFNDIISRGNCYLSYVDEDNYHFNLLGSLNDIFTRLLNSGWSSQKANEDDEYYQLTDFLKYNGQNYSDVPKLNRDVVYGSWEIAPSEHIFDLQELQNKYLSLALMHLNLTPKQVYLANLIGFAPTNQGYYADFESNKWFKKVNGRNQLVNVLCSDNTTEYELVGDGLQEQQIGEFRSYMQQPYIYVKRLLQIYQQEAKSMTGYDLFFDENWYNDKDFYTNQLVYMLPSLYSNATETILSNIEENSGAETIMPSYRNYSDVDNKVQNLNTFVTEYKGKAKKLNKNNYRFTGNIQINLRMDSSRTTAPYSIKYNYNNTIMVGAFIDEGNNVLSQKIIAVIPMLDEKNDDGTFVETIESTIGQDRYDLIASAVDEVTIVRYSRYRGGNDWILGNVSFSMDYISNGNKNVQLSYTANFGNNLSPFVNDSGQAINGSFLFNYLQLGRYYLNLKAKTNLLELTDGRSNQNLTMENLFKNINPFSIILKFTKLTGKIWVVDDYSKRVTIYNREDYFEKVLTENTNSKTPPIGDLDYQGVYDLTNLVDYSKTTKLASPSWNDRFLQFNFDDINADLFSEYREKYGMNYGSKKIITSNQKNNNTKNLFCNSENDTINPSMIASEFLLKVKDIKAGDGDLKVETYPQIVNSTDGNSANIWNNFYFRNKNGKFDNNIGEGWRPNYVIISDDLPEEKSGTYAWHSDDTNAIRAYNRPRFNSHTWGDEVSIQFAPSREVYHQFPYLSTTKYLYEQFFKNYVEQIYNYQSKKYEVYVTISSELYRRLKMNPFVQIQNTLFLCTKISDWNENNISTKCILVQIQDLNQLTNYKLPTISFDLLAFDDNSTMAFDNGDTILA